ncbi:hypothetical protein [Azospirillum doebereinerae]|uniref:Uncharacterized protein n=1 Tax=Azospirillum doebereinerae TaxID=92933 RepID=A0A3S0V365_9PROT|nr:hypothetical protein [Azospirillum doebereinerae]RUQ63961.1 hypothetical protein EJ913_26915 [Azospirillum doebereinerae]
MDTPHPNGPLGMVPSTAETAGIACAPKAGAAAGVPVDPSPYDAAALTAMVESLRRDLGEQLVSLAGGGTGFLRLQS